MIIAKGDGKIEASRPVKDRLAANEVNYRCLCEGWKDPICRGAK